MIERLFKGVKKRLYQYKFFYPRKNSCPVRWGIIGLGNMAEVFASALDGDKDSSIEAVASRSIDKATGFANRHGHGRAYGSYTEMLSDETLSLDVVYVATPAKYHADHIRLCLEAGKNVLCEKPITSNADELKGLMTLADKKGLFLMEGMWMKCLPTFQTAKDWLEQGKIGKLELVKVDFYKREQINPKLTIFNALEGGGVLHDFGIYAIAFATAFLGGKPEKIERVSRYSTFQIDADWQIRLEQAGVKAFVNLSSNFGGQSKAALIGSKGVIEWDAQFNRSNRIIRYDEFGKKQEDFVVRYKNEGFEYEIQEVRNCIQREMKQSEKVTLTASLDAIELVDKLAD
jgi:predicted dehydrogenase